MSTNKAFLIPPNDGDIIDFRGCSFSDGWEFGNPAVIYHPVQRYGEDEIYSIVEDVCIDLCCGKPVEVGFSKSDLREFKWRGWSPGGFKLRKSAHHEIIRIRFFKKGDRMSFEKVATMEPIKLATKEAKQ